MREAVSSSSNVFSRRRKSALGTIVNGSNSSSTSSICKGEERKRRGLLQKELNGAQFLAFIAEGMKRKRKRRRRRKRKKRRIGAGRKRGCDVGSLFGVYSVAKDAQ